MCGLFRFNVKLAQRFVCLLARLRERIEVRETGMASFIIRGGLAMPVRISFTHLDEVQE